MDAWVQEFRKKRLDYGISQRKLSVALGISRQYLNQIEGEKAVPPDDTKKNDGGDFRKIQSRSVVDASF